MISVTGTISLSENEIQFDFIRAGPGGQNVNKVASAAQLRFDVTKSPSLSDEIKNRLFLLARTKINKEGILIIEARRFRTQEANRKDAIERLVRLIHKSIQKPKIRRATRPTLASKKTRLDAKHHRAQAKHLRRVIPETDE